MKNIIISLLFLSTLLGCKKKEVEPQRNVTYKIQCTDCYVYYKENGQPKSEFHQNSTWSHDFVGMKDSLVLVYAMNTSGQNQFVSATILLNGDTLKHATGSCPISGTVAVSDTLQ